MKNILLDHNIITSRNRINPNLLKILEKYPPLKSNIISYTSFLDGDNIAIQERVYVILSGILRQPQCKVCNKSLRFVPSKKGYNTYCSVKCKSNDIELIKQQQTKLDKQRVDINKKIQNSKQSITKDQQQVIQDKRIQTLNIKYGTDNPWKDGVFSAKRKETNIHRYGTEFVSQNDQIKQKISDNHPRKIDGIYSEDLIRMNHNEGLTLTEISNAFQVSKHAIWTRFVQNNIPVRHHFKSIPQNIIENVLHENNIQFESNNRTILPNKQELDIFIPNYNIAIEINGIYWHSELHGGKEATYHVNKTIECNKLGITLLHFFDIEVLHKLDIVKSMILNRLQSSKISIYARKCTIHTIDNKTAYNFCEKNHMNGGVNSSIRYGLFYNDQLVSVLTASKSRFEKNTTEIVRFCSLLEHSVVGGFSKLLVRLQQDVINDIVSYSDRRFGTGNVYNSCKLQLVSTTPPNYYYFHTSKPNILYSRQKFQKHKLKDQLESFDPKLTEWQNMINNGYDRIWDCGNYKWKVNKI